MSYVFHHVALVAAVLALAQAAARVASTAAPCGLHRLVAAVTIVVATMVAESLALGLVGLGGSTIALVTAAAGTWAAAMASLPRPAVSIRTELVVGWRHLSRTARIGVAASSGAGIAWLSWQLLNPSIGFDSALYHYPFVAGWIDSGQPGSMLELSYEIPYGSYPLTDEVALTWGAAIARSWAPIALWNPALLIVLAAASWHTLRNLSVPRVAAALATAGLVSAPLLVRQLNEPQTDLPALTWLACSASLATAADRRPALLVPSVVAAGLAIGTKPSTAPMAVAVLAVGMYLARRHLRQLAGWLCLGLAAAFVVGGVWYTRNLIEHGSPLWPFVAAPWGDPQPRFIALVDTPFLERPIATLDGRLGEFTDRLGGGWILLLAALPVLLSGLLATGSLRPIRRPLIVSGALAMGALFLWSTAWGSGLSTSPELGFREGFPISSLRYMSPAIGAATIAVALVTRAGGLIGGLATGTLAVALAWSVVATARLGAPWTPPGQTVLLGALGGTAFLAAAMTAGPYLRRKTLGLRWAPAAGLALAVLLSGAILTLVGNGFIERYTKLERTTAYGSGLVAWFLEQPGFHDGEGTIAIASRGVVGQLVGDHFTHRLVLAPQWAPCREFDRLARRTPVVVTPPGFLRGVLGVEDYSAPRCLARHEPVFRRGAHTVYRLPKPAVSP